MKHKTMLLALVVVSGLLYSLPSMASAKGWDIDPAGVQFTSSGKIAKLVTTSGSTVTCETNSGTGRYFVGNQTTGEIELTFHGCTTTILGPANCTTAGQPEKTITTTKLEFHNIMLEPTTPGILITPNAGHFASFTCKETGGFGISANIVVGGNGIVGDISAPKCGSSSTTATLNFEQTGGVQKWKQTETTGTSYNLTSSTNGGEPVQAAEEATGTVTFKEKATITC